MPGPLTSIRSNTMPQGGMTALQSVQPEQIPAEIMALIGDMAPTIQKFRENSTPMRIKLKQASFKVAGDTASTDITSVGLGYRTISVHKAVITLNNTAAGAQVVNLSSYFPFNLIDNTQVGINGGTVSYSCSGKSGLVVAARNRRGFWTPYSNGLAPSIQRVTFANCTPTASTAFTFSGYASISIAAATTATITITFCTYEKLAYTIDSLLGALPLQNNSVNAQIVRRLHGNIVGTTNQDPFYVAGGVPGTLAPAYSSYTVDTYYDWWSVPSDPGLYAAMVGQSYQVQEQPNQTVNATGATALSYNMPTNQYHVASHIFVVDSNSVPVGYNGLSTLYLQYNGGAIRPVIKEADSTRFEEWLTYGSDIRSVPGYFLWDGDATSDALTDTDEAGWIDAYYASQPQILGDVATTLSTPLNYSVTREIIAAGQVQVIGG